MKNEMQRDVIIQHMYDQYINLSQTIIRYRKRVATSYTHGMTLRFCKNTCNAQSKTNHTTHAINQH